MAKHRLSLAALVWMLAAQPGVAQTINAAAPQSTVAATAPASDQLMGKDIALILGQLITALIAGTAVWASLTNTKRQIASANENAAAQRWRDANLKEVEKLEELVRTFHVPYLVRSEANHNMAQDLRDRLNDPTYRMLIKLFDPNWLTNLSPGNRTLVDEICATGLALRDFIEENGGGVDVALTEHLARASTHFRMLWLAHEGELGTDPKPFERYVYPRQLDPAIRTDLKRLLDRCAMLRAEPSKDHGLIGPLVLSPEAVLDPWPDPTRYDPVTGTSGSAATASAPSSH
ncbi:hypothetical protein [Sphingomonas sp. MS122]|uniref:hypothetical protein n=1 Tax=Sphingomonas sp. MS122 TaxID=3412683 RepID=UPI003C2E45DF